jgi:hypothetical protein
MERCASHRPMGLEKEEEIDGSLASPKASLRGGSLDSPKASQTDGSPDRLSITDRWITRSPKHHRQITPSLPDPVLILKCLQALFIPCKDHKYQQQETAT